MSKKDDTKDNANDTSSLFPENPFAMFSTMRKARSLSCVSTSRAYLSPDSYTISRKLFPAASRLANAAFLKKLKKYLKAKSSRGEPPLPESAFRIFTS